jgi:hypothetical protein
VASPKNVASYGNWSTNRPRFMRVHAAGQDDGGSPGSDGASPYHRAAAPGVASRTQRPFSIFNPEGRVFFTTRRKGLCPESTHSVGGASLTNLGLG